MSGTVYGKWYWSDWMSDPGVRASSYAARGLWIDLLCIAATADPTGYVVLNGRPLIASDIARLTGGVASEVEILLDELERNGVFTRDRHGRIYSRRMVRETRNAKTNRENGRKGGNPSLRGKKENSGPDNPPVKPGDKTQKPEARNQKPASASSSTDLRKLIAAAFQELAPNRLVPDTNRAAVWLAQGYDAELILSVIREGLARKPDIGSLSYFDRRLEETHGAPHLAAGPSEPGRPTVVGLRPRDPSAPAPLPDPAKIRRGQIQIAAEHFRGRWHPNWPNTQRPDHPDCTLPEDVVEEARAIVDAEKAMSPAEMAASMGFVLTPARH